MGVQRIYTDRYELVLTVVGRKKVARVNVPRDRIKSIAFDPCRGGLFGNRASEKITIQVTGMEPIVYEKHREKAYFDSYKVELEKFCTDNRVTFYNHL